MALALDCNTSARARLAACLLCSACLRSAAAEEPAVEAAAGASAACEALMQGLLIGVLGITAAALKDRARATRRAAPQGAAAAPPARAPPTEPPPAAPAAAAAPPGRAGRPGVPPWARAGDGRGSPAAASEPGDFGEMLAAVRDHAPRAPAAPAAEAAGPSRARRAALPKPGRGARVVQVRSKVAEFCSLRFDEVDTTEQMGLTCRMLATLKSFAHDVTYWEEGVKIDEPAFTLLGLDEVAQFALLRTAERAAALVDERCWREAYQALCAARPWVSSEPDSGPAQEQRAGAEAELARAEARARRESGEPRGPPRTGPCGGSAAGGPPAAGSVAVVVRLPAGGAGRVLGPHAATVTALQAETGARVWLDRASDEAHVSGTPEAVEAVRRGIRFLLTPVRGEEADTSPKRAPLPSKKECAPIMCRFFQNGTCNRGSACHFLHAPAQPSSDDEETRASTDDEPLGGTSAKSSRAAGRAAPPARPRTGSGGARPARGAAGSASLSGIWQECPDVAYRVQSHSELSWTCVPCGGGGASRKKEPIGYDEAAGVYWLGAARAHVAVRAGPDRLDWYPAGDQERSRPAFSWLRQQRRHLAPA